MQRFSSETSENEAQYFQRLSAKIHSQAIQNCFPGDATPHEEMMNLNTILEDLRREREQIDEAILSLERLAAGSGPRRGRPPAWLKEQKTRGRVANGKETATAKSVSGN